MHPRRSGHLGRPELLLVVLGTLSALGLLVAPLAASPRPDGWVPADRAPAVRLALEPVQPFYFPDDPARFRFMIYNNSDEVLELPITSADGDTAVGLPLELMLGTENEPALMLAYENEPLRALAVRARGELASTASAQTPPPEIPTILRLAPRAVLGGEVDLRPHHSMLRYTGRHRLEWRPLGGRLGAATAAVDVDPRREIVVVTDLGKMTFRVAYDEAPQNVRNFLELARSGFYDGKSFHRLLPGQLLQGGCPEGTGRGMRPDRKTVPAEFSDWPIDAGTLVMARLPSDPDSASCQFFIGLARLRELDGTFTVIGQASDEESLATLRRLNQRPVDGQDRPLEPLLIRSVNLVVAAEARVRRLEVSPTPRPVPPPPVSTPDEE
ncbi:MAG: peptidylprolyl isomerase [Phycisphaerales bacterium]|nr:peptidylprolyl isomerase [Phycisphaerales bacterium]